MSKLVLFSLLLLSITLPKSYGQSNDSSKIKIVQLTGITVESDSLSPLPFTNIVTRGSYRGTFSDFSGFFSIVAATGDTLVFSSLGYQSTEFIIPDSLESKHYSLIQMMDRDTILLETTEIRVWPTYEQFKYAFLNTEVPDDELTRAKNNLDAETMEEMRVELGLGASGNQSLMLNNYKSRLYYSGQLPPNNLLNPIAWMKFIQAWKEGSLNNKKDAR
jgi:hypothetical protein